MARRTQRDLNMARPIVCTLAACPTALTEESRHEARWAIMDAITEERHGGIAHTREAIQSAHVAMALDGDPLGARMLMARDMVACGERARLDVSDDEIELMLAGMWIDSLSL
jgi:hypothetical protein